MSDHEQLPRAAGPSPRERRLLASAALFFLDLVKMAIVAGVTIGLVRYFLFKPFYVKGQSMEPNFREREYLIIDELSYRFREPARGEVVVFRSPVNPKEYYLKRVVGLPGERVKIADNKVVVYNAGHPEGVVVEESYISAQTAGALSVTLSHDQFFVLGDNREESFDSRRFGAISSRAIIGRTLLRGWPVSRAGILRPPQYNL